MSEWQRPQSTVLMGLFLFKRGNWTKANEKWMSAHLWFFFFFFFCAHVISRHFLPYQPCRSEMNHANVIMKLGGGEDLAIM